MMVANPGGKPRPQPRRRAINPVSWVDCPSVRLVCPTMPTSSTAQVFIPRSAFRNEAMPSAKRAFPSKMESVLTRNCAQLRTMRARLSDAP